MNEERQEAAKAAEAEAEVAALHSKLVRALCESGERGESLRQSEARGAAMQRTHEEEIAEMITEHARELERLRNLREAALDALRSELASEIAARREEARAAREERAARERRRRRAEAAAEGVLREQGRRLAACREAAARGGGGGEGAGGRAREGRGST